MAIYRQSPLASAISGAVGGVEFVRSRGTPVIRKRQHKIRRPTEAQTTRHARVAKVVHKWNALSDDDRLQWATVASLMPLPNRLGVFRTLSAYQLYLKVNLTVPDPSATSSSVPNPDFSPEPPPTLTTDFDAANYDLSWTRPATGLFPFANIFGWAYSQPKPRKNPPTWKFIQQAEFFTATGTVDLRTAWIDALGELVEGQHFAIRLHTYLISAIPGTWVYANDVRAA